MSNWKKFRVNFASYGYSQLVTLVVQFIAVPFFLVYWDESRYAEWLVLSGIPLMLGILEFGVAHATASRAVIFSKQNEFKKLQAALQTSFVYSNLIGAGILTAVIAISSLVDIGGFLDISLSKTDISIVLIALSIHLWTQLLGGWLNAWFFAIDKAPLGYFLLANRRLIDVAITIVVLICSGEVAELAIAMAFVQLVMLGALIVFLNTTSPIRVLGVKEAAFSEFLIVFKPGLAFAGISASQVVILQMGMQIMNQVAPASAVVAYSMGRTLMRLLLQLGTVTNHALRPFYGNAIKEKVTDSEKLLIKIFALFSIITLILYAILAAIGPTIIEVWSRGQVMMERHDLLMLGIHAVLHTLWIIPASALMVNNFHSVLGLLYSVSAVCVVTIGWTITKLDSLSTAEVAIGMAIPELLAALYMLFRKKTRA